MELLDALKTSRQLAVTTAVEIKAVVECARMCSGGRDREEQG